MRRKLDPVGTPVSFIELIISVIRILSGLYVFRSSSAASSDDKSCNTSNGTHHASELALIEEYKVDGSETYRKCCSSERTSSQKSFNTSDNSQLLPITRFDYSVSSSETPSTSMSDTCSLKIRVGSSMSGSCSNMSRGSNGGAFATDYGSSKDFGLGKRSSFLEDAKLEFLRGQSGTICF